jgi:hypothetical protein
MIPDLMRIQIDLEKLRNCEGLDVAIGWIAASHDYNGMLDLERDLLNADEERENGPSIFPIQVRSYFTRLRAAQTREAVGLCRETQNHENLMAIIEKDKHGAKEAFERLKKWTDEGPKNNSDMELVVAIRNVTYHYVLTEGPERYKKTIDEMLAHGEKYVAIQADREPPLRFAPADKLFQNMFFGQVLGVDVRDIAAAGKRLNEIAIILASAANDFDIVAKAISNGLVQAYEVTERP